MAGGGGFGGGRGGASSVSSWVAQSCRAVTSVATGLYDCATAVGS